MHKHILKGRNTKKLMSFLVNKYYKFWSKAYDKQQFG